MKEQEGVAGEARAIRPKARVRATAILVLEIATN